MLALTEASAAGLKLAALNWAEMPITDTPAINSSAPKPHTTGPTRMPLEKVWL